MGQDKNITEEDEFIQAINEMARRVHENAVAHGWYDKEPSVPEVLMNMVSELSEALESYRNGEPVCYVTRDVSLFPQYESCISQIEDIDEWKPNEKPEGFGTELADCLIRILDTCAFYRIDIGTLIIKKHRYNKTRPYKHGDKVI